MAESCNYVNQWAKFTINCGRRLKRAPAAVRDVTASGRSLSLNGRRLETENISANAYRHLIITALYNTQRSRRTLLFDS